MPGYVRHALDKLQHVPSILPQYSPHPFVQTRWTAKGDLPYTRQPDTSPYLSLLGIKYVQTSCILFLYYARYLDSTMLPALNDIGTQQAHLTLNTKATIQNILNYAYTYQDVIMRFYASNMQLHVDIYAAYLFLPKARSCIAGYFRFLNHPSSPKAHYVNNGPILIEFCTPRSVVTSDAEAETHGVFYNAKKSLPIWYILEDIGHSQAQPTPIQTENSTSIGYVTNNMQMKCSKTWDMHLH